MGNAFPNGTDYFQNGGISSRGGPILFVFTAQNLHPLVQMSLITMKVAVPLLQHSPILGQCASSHTVCSPSSLAWCLIQVYRSPPGARTFSHGGLVLCILSLVPVAPFPNPSPRWDRSFLNLVLFLYWEPSVWAAVLFSQRRPVFDLLSVVRAYNCRAAKLATLADHHSRIWPSSRRYFWL